MKNLGKHIDVVAGIYDEGFLKERQCQAAKLSYKTLALSVPLSHPLCDKKSIAPEDLKNTDVMFITKGWNIMDDIRKDLISLGVNLIDFDFFNINTFNKAEAAAKHLPPPPLPNLRAETATCS